MLLRGDPGQKVEGHTEVRREEGGRSSKRNATRKVLRLMGDHHRQEGEQSWKP